MQILKIIAIAMLFVVLVRGKAYAQAASASTTARTNTPIERAPSASSAQLKEKVTQDISDLKKRADQGDAIAQRELGTLYLSGSNQAIPQDIGRAYSWLYLSSLGADKSDNINRILDEVKEKLSKEELKRAEGRSAGWTHRYNKNKKNPSVVQSPSRQALLDLDVCEIASEAYTGSEQAIQKGFSECKDYPSMLEACKPYSCSHKDLISNDQESKIVGEKDGKCLIVSTRKNSINRDFPNSKMRYIDYVTECFYSVSERKKEAEINRAMTSGRFTGICWNEDGDMTFTLDGKEVLVSELESGSSCKTTPMPHN